MKKTENEEVRAALAEAKSRAVELLSAHENIFILTHRNPDGDAIGAVAATVLTLAGCGKKPVALINEIKSEETRFMAECIADYTLYGESPERLPGKDDLVLLLDCANSERVDRCFADLVKSAACVAKVDHHQDSCDALQYVVDVTDPGAAAACEVLCDILFLLAAKYGFTPGRDVATALYGGIMTDSGRFTYSCTTGDTMRTAGALLDIIDGDVSWMSKRYYDLKPLTSLRLLGVALLNTQIFADGRVALLAIRDDFYSQAGGKPGDVGYVIPQLMNIEGVKISAVIKPAEEGDDREFRVSMRSTEEYDVAALCRTLGGGGHKCAAGAAVYADSIDGAFETVKGLCLGALRD